MIMSWISFALYCEAVVFMMLYLNHLDFLAQQSGVYRRLGMKPMSNLEKVLRAIAWPVEAGRMIVLTLWLVWRPQR